MPPHQPSASHGPVPTGVPSSSPRMVSVAGVTGWWLAKPRIQDGMVATGTNALLA